MKRATLSPRARRGLTLAVAWIAADSPSAARRLRDAVRSVTMLIGEHPLSGTERLDAAPRPFRFSPGPGFPHLLVYDASRSPPVIASAVHGARDMPEVLRDL